MNKLVIFYSFEGSTKLVAESIAESIDADILRLKPKNEIKSKGFMRFIWAVKAAIMREKPELLPFDKSIEEYDVLFIGTPVWVWAYAAPLNTFLSKHAPSGKKIAVFCCHAGGKGKTLKNMKQALKDNTILGELDLSKPARRDTQASVQKATDWAQEIVRSLYLADGT